MKMNKTLQLGAIALSLLTLMACQNQGPEKAPDANQPPVQEETELEHMEIVGRDIETDQKVGNDMLTQDLNIVFVWQPSCPPCQAEAKAIEDIYQDFQDVNIIGLGVAENEQAVQGTIEEWGMTFKNYYVNVEDIGKISENIRSTPTMLVLDKDGNELQSKVVGSSSSGEDLDNLAQELRERIQGVIDEQK